MLINYFSSIQCPSITCLSQGPSQLISVTIQVYNMDIRLHNDYTFVKHIVMSKYTIHTFSGGLILTSSSLELLKPKVGFTSDALAPLKPSHTWLLSKDWLYHKWRQKCNLQVNDWGYDLCGTSPPILTTRKMKFSVFAFLCVCVHDNLRTA